MLGTKKIYRNKEWLEKEYLIKKQSCPQIAKECKTSPPVIWNWLHKFCIPTRSAPEAISLVVSNHVILTKEALEFLDGELLGDGHLCTFSKCSACFMYGSKYKSYLEWLSTQLELFGIKQAGRIYKSRGKFPGYSKTYISFHYSSKSYIELKDLHSKWYRRPTIIELKKDPRRKYIKKLPLNLRLTPLICRQWYIGDGSLVINLRSNHISLSTQGFKAGEVDLLIEKLKELNFITTKQKDNGIRILTASTPDFLNYIGPCPIKCYKYKWELQRSES